MNVKFGAVPSTVTFDFVDPFNPMLNCSNKNSILHVETRICYFGGLKRNQEIEVHVHECQLNCPRNKINVDSKNVSHSPIRCHCCVKFKCLCYNIETSEALVVVHIYLHPYPFIFISGGGFQTQQEAPQPCCNKG